MSSEQQALASAGKVCQHSGEDAPIREVEAALGGEEAGPRLVIALHFDHRKRIGEASRRDRLLKPRAFRVTTEGVAQRLVMGDEGRQRLSETVGIESHARIQLDGLVPVVALRHRLLEEPMLDRREGGQGLPARGSWPLTPRPAR